MLFLKFLKSNFKINSPQFSKIFLTTKIDDFTEPKFETIIKSGGDAMIMILTMTNHAKHNDGSTFAIYSNNK